jgi:hypothetical protein
MSPSPLSSLFGSVKTVQIAWTTVFFSPILVFFYSFFDSKNMCSSAANKKTAKIIVYGVQCAPSAPCVPRTLKLLINTLVCCLQDWAKDSELSQV